MEALRWPTVLQPLLSVPQQARTAPRYTDIDKILTSYNGELQINLLNLQDKEQSTLRRLAPSLTCATWLWC